MNKNQISKIAKDLSNDQKIKQLTDKYNLTLPEQIALRHYTGDGYRSINQMHNGLIKGGDDLYLELAAASKVLSSALDKLPDHKGKVVRRTYLPDDVLALHQEGSIVTYDAFTSSTKGKNDVFEQKPHRLVIKSKTGKKIDWISKYKGKEDEVLFGRPKRFKVIDRIDHPDGIVEIWLEEL